MWVLTGCFVIVVVAMGAVIVGQRAVIGRKREDHWRQEQEIARLLAAVDQWAADFRRTEAANDRLIDRLLQEQSKPPLIVQPPDVANIVERVGETVALAIYGRQQQDKADLQLQQRETSMVHEQYKQGEWFPEVEFDPQMGQMPTHGGWVNGQSNQNLPPAEGQTPQHAVAPDGRLVRLDGQSLFQAGQGASMPTGGVE